MQPDEKKKIWFPAKQYGWGWGLPCCWQGWAVYGVWALLLCGGGVFLLPNYGIGLFYFAYIALLSIALIIICFLKGEKPRWRCGKD